MDKKTVLRKLSDSGIVPVIRTNGKKDAINIVNALSKGGIKVTEITMTTPEASVIINRLTQNLECQILVGAGTVIDTAMCQNAIEAGSKFIVTPGFNPDIIKLCIKKMCIKKMCA